jgi:hypothetical protein
MPLNDIPELSKTHPVLIAERPKRNRDLLREVANGYLAQNTERLAPLRRIRPSSPPLPAAGQHSQQGFPQASYRGLPREWLSNWEDVQGHASCGASMATVAA